MAVRNDFTAGEVLTAADLNDTFASKQADVMTTKGDLAAYGTAVARLGVGTNGQVLTADSGETLGVKWADASGGLTLITTETFSAVSSVNINNCFTSSYENYLLTFRLVGSSGSGDISWRLRASGTDASSGNYNVYGGYDGSSAGATNTTGGTAWFSAGPIGSTSYAGQMTLWRPAEATATDAIYLAGYTNFGIFAYAQHTLSTSYDGISLNQASGTITGAISIYGLQES